MSQIDRIEDLNKLRQRILNNEDVPPEELRAALNQLRSHRTATAEAKAKKKEPKLPSNLGDLFAATKKPKDGQPNP